MRRRLRALLLVAAVCAGCSASAEPDETVVLWAMGREGEVVAAMLDDFEREHPEIRVRVQQVPWSAAHEKLVTAYVGGSLPDVFQAGTTWIAELVALGALEPLDERLAASDAVDRDDYFPGVLEGNVVAGASSGRIWGVPWYVDTRLLFYRSDLLAAAGHAAPPRTWDEWRAAMEAVKARGEPGAFALLAPLTEWEVPVTLALQRGATLLRDDDRFGDFESAAVRDAFGFYLELFQRGLAPVAGATQVGNVYQDFARGWFAFYVTGPWNLDAMATRLPPDLEGRWATAPLPAPGDDYPGVSLAGGASLVVARDSPRKDAAWAVVEYLSTPAAQVRFHQLSGDLPARRAAWRDAGLETAPHTAAFWQQLERVKPPPRIPEWERIAALVARHTERAVRGVVSLDEALAALDRDVDILLEKRRWLASRKEPS
jgi:multiple sugar transport system substrate-binding protein